MGQAFLADGVREYNGYPTVSLGWIMFVGMAIAKFWDEDWEKYSKVDDLYVMLRDVRGYDCMDEYICAKVLSLARRWPSTPTLALSTNSISLAPPCN